MDSLFHTRETEAPTASLVYSNAVVIRSTQTQLYIGMPHNSFISLRYSLIMQLIDDASDDKYHLYGDTAKNCMIQVVTCGWFVVEQLIQVIN